MNQNYKKYPVTYIMVVVIIFVYIYTTLKYGIEMDAYQGIEAGGFNPIYVIYFKQYYRLITANFIHFGLMHVFCNTYSLCNLGSLMETILEKKRYMIVLFGSMLTTTMIPCCLYLINETGTYSIMGGISGAIFGLMGSLLALAWRYKDVYMYLFKQIAPSVILMLVISFAVPSISLVGHVSGMIGGFVITLLIIRFYPLHRWKIIQYQKQDEHLVN